MRNCIIEYVDWDMVSTGKSKWKKALEFYHLKKTCKSTIIMSYFDFTYPYSLMRRWNIEFLMK